MSKKRDRIAKLLERPICDYAIVVAVIAATVLLSRRWHEFDVLAAIPSAQRADMYLKILGPLSIVASIATAGLAVYATGKGPRLSLLRAVHGERLLKQFRGAAVSAGMAVLALIVSYVGEAGHEATWARWTAISALLFVVVRTVRVLYFYTGLLITAGDDATEPARRRPSIDDPPRRVGKAA